MKKEIFVDGRFDYTLSIEKVKNKTTYSLHYSNDSEWTNPEGFIMSLTDDGNGFKLSKLRKANKMDYDEALELSILLRAAQLSDNYKIEVVESKKEL